MLTQDDKNAIHDVLFELIGYEPMDTEIMEAYNKLDFETQRDIEHWGAQDTVVRDAIFVELSELYTP